MAQASIPEDKLAALRTLYDRRLDEQCGDLTRAVDALTQHPENAAARDRVAGLTHAIKGGGGSIGYGLVTTVAAQADDLLRKRMTLTPADLTSLMFHAEALALIARHRLTGGGRAGGPRPASGTAPVLPQPAGGRLRPDRVFGRPSSNPSRVASAGSVPCQASFPCL